MCQTPQVAPLMNGTTNAEIKTMIFSYVTVTLTINQYSSTVCIYTIVHRYETSYSSPDRRE